VKVSSRHLSVRTGYRSSRRTRLAILPPTVAELIEIVSRSLSCNRKGMRVPTRTKAARHSQVKNETPVDRINQISDLAQQ
jgi:hypothetical protein